MAVLLGHACSAHKSALPITLSVIKTENLTFETVGCNWSWPVQDEIDCPRCVQDTDR